MIGSNIMITTIPVIAASSGIDNALLDDDGSLVLDDDGSTVTE